MFENLLKILEQYGAWGLALHSFADAIIFPIPAFFMQVSLSAVAPSSALWLATVGFIACLAGTPLGYLIGRTVGQAILNKILKPEWVERASELFRKHGETAVLIGAFTPIPFKVFTILSGSLNFPLWQLMTYAALGRAVKFYAVGGLFYIYGRAAEGMVKDVTAYIGIGAVVLFVLYYGIRRFIRARRKARGLAAGAARETAADRSDAETE